MAGYIYRLSYVPSYRRKTQSLSVDRTISLQVWKNLLDSVFSTQNSWKTKVSLSLNKEQDKNKTVKVMFLLINI